MFNGVESISEFPAANDKYYVLIGKQEWFEEVLVLLWYGVRTTSSTESGYGERKATNNS